MANKKLFELELGTPATSDKLAYGKVGSVYKNITYGDFKALIIAAIPAPPAPALETTVVNIGSFDMAGGDRSKELNLGVVRSKIRSVVVMILSNSGGLYPILFPDQAGNTDEVQQYWYIRQESTYASNARIKIQSKNGGYFDQSAFDGNGPSNNRGYITIIHTP